MQIQTKICKEKKRELEEFVIAKNWHDASCCTEGNVIKQRENDTTIYVHKWQRNLPKYYLRGFLTKESAKKIMYSHNIPTRSKASIGLKIVARWYETQKESNPMELLEEL